MCRFWIVNVWFVNRVDGSKDVCVVVAYVQCSDLFGDGFRSKCFARVIRSFNKNIFVKQFFGKSTETFVVLSNDDIFGNAFYIFLKFVFF